MRRFPLFILILAVVCACENRPENVMPKDKMEDVLYDYHLAQGMINDMNTTDRKNNSQKYINSVFKKHGITQAEFDTSLVWYNKNTDKLHDIYKNLKKRFDDLNKELQLQNGNNDMMAMFTTGGDTSDIWGSRKIIVLRDNVIQRRESFTIVSDTSFHKGDTYVLMCKLNMIVENKNEHKECVTTGLNLTYKDGLKVGVTKQNHNSGQIQITLTADNSGELSQITGFFYFTGNSNYRSIAVLDDIKLIRMHKQEEKTDTATMVTTEPDADAKIEDTIPAVDEKTLKPHLTPEQIHAMGTGNKKIQIKTAPDKRTPNQYGRRKR